MRPPPFTVEAIGPEHGQLRLYRRKWREPGLARYTVYNWRTGKFLEDFRRRAKAERWIARQPEGR